MTEPIAPLSRDQVDRQVDKALHESAPHRVVEMADATIRSLYGPQDETISSGIARDLMHHATGLKLEAATALEKLLNVISPNHAEKAMIADYVRAVMEQRRLRVTLPASTVVEIDKILTNSW